MRDRMAGVRNRRSAHGVDGPPPQCNPHSPNTPPPTKSDLDIQNSLNTTAIRVSAVFRSPKPTRSPCPSASHPGARAQCGAATIPICRVPSSAAERTICRAEERCVPLRCTAPYRDRAERFLEWNGIHDCRVHEIDSGLSAARRAGMHFGTYCGTINEYRKRRRATGLSGRRSRRTETPPAIRATGIGRMEENIRHVR